MSMQDPIASLLAGINNAQTRLKPNLSVPSSTKKIALLKVLEREGYIESFNVSDSAKPELTVNLKYFEGKPVIREISRVSRPGCRIYSKIKDLPKV